MWALSALKSVAKCADRRVMLVSGGIALWLLAAMQVEPGAVAPAPAPPPPTESTPAPEATPGAEPAPVTEVAPAAPAPAEATAAQTVPVPATGVPVPKQVPAQLAPQSTPAPSAAEDPWARPFFVKGDLQSFSIRPLTRRNFIGVATGISALPTNADTAINAYFLSVEPQVDIVNTTYNWRLSLGVPLQFELADTRGAFENCIGEAKQLRSMGSTQNQIAAATGVCITRQKNRMTENMGRLRRADWDEASDFAKIIRHAVVGGQEQPFYLSLSRLYDQSFGHGTLVRHYNPNIDYNTARLGANLDFSRAAVGVQAMANDLVRPDVLGVMGFVRPLRPFSNDVLLRSLSLGVSWVHGANQPTGLKYEKGLFGRSFDQPLPAVDKDLNMEGTKYHQTSFINVDLEAKVVRSDWADVKVYTDFDKMLDYDSAITLGTLLRFSFGQPAHQALRARAELSTFGPAYMPNYFDTFHDIFQYQYLPAGYRASNGLTYYPTKLEFLDASRGGRRRVGAYGELTHAIVDLLSVGAVVRGWTAYGDPAQAGFVGPQFTDWNGATCRPGADANLQCDNKVGLGKEPGFSSLRLHAELPFRRFLQAFVSYEAFSSVTEGGLGAFKLDGDNEVLFSGARIMLLPILFVQAEGRRYFFMQRLSNVDTKNLTFEQDQNFHSRWTFAINASLGYEF
jgi:hypothetical protein